MYPNPGSSGSMVNRDRVSLSDSSVRVGRWVMSTCFLRTSGARYMTPSANVSPPARDAGGAPGRERTELYYLE